MSPIQNSLEIKFDAVNGLKPCLGAPPKEKQIEVQYASEWKDKSNGKDVERLHFDYDWTYTTDYKGDYRPLHSVNDDDQKGRNGDGALHIDHDVEERFNMQLLKDTTAPILWSCHCILYEDELSDNGMHSLKFTQYVPLHVALFVNRNVTVIGAVPCNAQVLFGTVAVLAESG